MVTITLEEYEENMGDMMGLCLSCGEFQDGCEPDAREYKCESCGKHKVYGLDEVMIMGLVS